MRTIFELKNISVNFDKHSITHKTLRYSLAAKINGEESEKIHALKNLSITIKDGENVGLIGRNGAGKSTLLKVLTGVITPQSGVVNSDTGKHIVPLLELGIGFQPELSGRENCYLSGILMGYKREEIKERLNDIINFAELKEFIDEPVKNYSSGMYARLAFALATDVKPDVLIVDEVFGVGDEFFMRKCMMRMQRLMRQGSTTVFVSHNLDFLVTQCSRLIWLDRGCIVMDGQSYDVAENYRRTRGEAA